MTEMEKGIGASNCLWLSITISLLLSVSDRANASPKLLLYFNDRPPYLEVGSDGAVHGLTATPAAKALEKAGIPFQWKKASAEQQLAAINRNAEPACLVGWFKRPERQLLGKFSVPIYAGSRMVALSLSSNPRLIDRMRVVDLVKSTELTMLAKSGYSYGNILDQHIRNFSPKQEFATGENINMLQMLIHGRADYFLVSEEEAVALIERSGRSKHDFRLTYFVEGIKEDTRHFWCTRQTPDGLILKLNGVLQSTVARQRKQATS
ncbi:transporter substrate-binding domain-containing protein [Undibacterium cyanobacteriorum]|uniref:Transporter substrate-binding domain-containing protein n=1 Tax=Undibacterium cyanobacteriorum TaxID=3073561 RepID=A0ABY9RME9_9BURK|nr:transporter substrate-binding domain-containing protein [Undibacterium sp. 20NA77.5]WMW82379.1 transporter substrate-binding domain-containing protein [Undibacterium sp. 20NA77.5]